MDFLVAFFNNFISEIAFATIAALFGIGFFHFRRLFRVVQKGHAARSPDGRNTAYEYDGDVFISNRDGINNFTHSRAVDYGIAWSPNSRWLCFQSASAKDDKHAAVLVADVGNSKTANILTYLADKKFPRLAHWDQESNLHIDLGGSVVMVKREELEKRLI